VVIKSLLTNSNVYLTTLEVSVDSVRHASLTGKGKLQGLYVVSLT
jgi:hypothetical protein